MSLCPAVVLAGGSAMRLRPITERIPKAMIEIAGEPFVAHQLRLLASQGIREAVFCVGYLAGQIEEFAGDGSRFGVRIRYSHDGDAPLGTAGAIRRALPVLAGDFFVLYGDSYLPCNYRRVQEAYFAAGKPALMTVYHNEGQWDSSNVEWDGAAIAAYDKVNRTPRMRHIDYGLGLFQRRVFEELSEGARDLASVYQQLLGRQQLSGLDVPERFYEVGSVQGIEDFTAYLEASKQS